MCAECAFVCLDSAVPVPSSVTVHSDNECLNGVVRVCAVSMCVILLGHTTHIHCLLVSVLSLFVPVITVVHSSVRMP